MRLPGITIYIFSLLVSHKAYVQGSVEKVMEYDIYGGGTYITGGSDYSDKEYYDDLRKGLNVGGQILFFLNNVGIGFNYDQSNYSSNGGVLESGDRIEEQLKTKFYGPVVANRIEINKYNYIIFTFSYGRIKYDEKATLDGGNGHFQRKDWVPKFGMQYQYHIEDFSVNVGIQFIKGEEGNSSLSRRYLSIYTPRGGGIVGYRHLRLPEITYDMLSINLGVAYHLRFL